MSRRTRKPKKVAPRARHKAKTKITVKHCKPGAGCEPAMPGAREWQEALQELRLLLGSKPRGEFISKLPDDFFRWLLDTRGSISRIEENTGISSMTTRRELRRRGIPWDHSRVPQDLRYESYDALIADCHDMCPKIEDNRIPADSNYLIVTCLHVPTISDLWVKRAVAVAKHEGCKAMVIVGDLVNADALSYYAQTERGLMPRFQNELQASRALLELLGRDFKTIYLLAGNHEMRLVKRMQQEFEASDYFESIFKHGKWFEGDELLLGDITLAHGRGRKVLSSAPNEYGLVAEGEYFLGGPHRFFVGYSQSGRRIGMLGGLFDKERIAYYMRHIKLNHWVNGFWIYKQGGLMLPFAEGFVDWSRYNCR